MYNHYSILFYSIPIPIPIPYFIFVLIHNKCIIRAHLSLILGLFADFSQFAIIHYFQIDHQMTGDGGLAVINVTCHYDRYRVGLNGGLFVMVMMNALSLLAQIL